MKRRTLDIMFSIGGIIFSLLLVAVGLILTNQKNFAENYVRSQLREQEINFKLTEKLGDDAEFQATMLEKFNGDQAAADAFIAQFELTSEAGSVCLTRYGADPDGDGNGMQLLTGKQAECYAEDYIKLHALESSIVDGVHYTYATIGPLVTEARAAVTAAKEGGATQEEIDELQAKADTLQRLRVDTLLRADTLRGLLLTTYGFSVFGERAGQAAWVCFAAAVVLFLLSIAGLFHAFFSKKADDVLLVAEHHEPATS